MSALIVVDLNPIDKDKMSTYSALAAKTLAAFGGEFIAKGPIASLHGDNPFSTKVVIQFPDREQAEQWYASDAYQEIIPIRDQGMESQFHLVG